MRVTLQEIFRFFSEQISNPPPLHNYSAFHPHDCLWHCPKGAIGSSSNRSYFSTLDQGLSLSLTLMDDQKRLKRSLSYSNSATKDSQSEFRISMMV